MRWLLSSYVAALLLVLSTAFAAPANSGGPDYMLVVMSSIELVPGSVLVFDDERVDTSRVDLLWPRGYPPCPFDEAEGGPCFWDATTRGNGEGDSFWLDRNNEIHYIR